MARNVDATAQIRADNRRLRGDLSKSQSMFRKAFAGIGAGIKGALRGALSPLGVGLGIAGVAVAFNEVVEFEDVLGRVGIQAKLTSSETESLRNRITELSKASAISRGEVLGGAAAIVQMMGRVENLDELVGVLTETMIASGATSQEVAGLMFSMRNSFGITEAKDFEKGLSGIIEAGNLASVSLSETSQGMQTLSASFAEFGAKSGAGGVTELAVALQIMRRGFGGAQEGATGLQSLLTALFKNAVQLKKQGIHVFEADGTTFRDVRAIVAEYQKLDPKKQLKVQTTLGRVEAMKALKVLEANSAELDDFVRKAKASDAVQTQAEQRRQQAAFKIQKAMNDLKLSIAEAFTPGRVAMIAELMARVARLVGLVSDHSTEILAIWGALKLAKYVDGFVAMRRAAAALAASSAASATSTAAGAVAAKAWATHLVAAAAAGFAIGTVLDRWLGLSDKISDATAPMTGGVSEARGAILGLGDFSGDPTDAKSQRQQRLRANRVLLVARESGFLNAEGTGAKTDAEISKALNDGKGRRGITNQDADAMAPTIAASIARALEISAKTRGATETVHVKISVDQNGMIRANQIADDTDARRQ